MNMKFRLSILFLILITTISCSTIQERAFNNLRKGKKEQAFVSFVRINGTNSNSVIANYGLALLYSDATFIQYDLEQAYSCAQRAKKNVDSENWHDLGDESELKNIAKIKIQPRSILTLTDSIDNALFEKVKKMNTIASFDKFIVKHPDSKYIKTAEEYIRNLAYIEVTQTNTIEAYKQFVIDYPNTREARLVQGVIDELAYKAALMKNNIEAFNQFIAEYPNAKQIGDAKRKITEIAFSQAKEKNTIAAYEEFIANYPEANEVQQAKESIEGIKNLDNTTVTDIDGNVYKTVTIGNQTWMAENLKVTHYRDGTAIPNVSSNTSWAALTTGAYCDYNNTLSISADYGKLYNWYVVADIRNVAPLGWHVATDAEWVVLREYSNAHFGKSISVSKSLAANSKWIAYTTIGSIGNDLTINNSLGFTLLPGGNRNNATGIFDAVTSFGGWWSSTENTVSTAWNRDMHNTSTDLGRYDTNKKYGMSIRCIKD